MPTITRVNYDELTIITKKFGAEADDFAQLSSSTRQKLAALHSEWAGEAADKFFEEMENVLLPAMQRLSQGLIVSQEVLTNIMKTVYEADLETGSFFKEGVGEDFGAGKFEDALGNLEPSGGGTPGSASGEDFGAGKFEEALVDSGTPGGNAAGSADGASSQYFGPSSKDLQPFQTGSTSTSSETPAESTPAQSAAAGGGGGGGGTSGQGLQGSLDGMGAGLGGQSASNASVGGAPGSGAESLPDHVFGGSGGGSSAGGSGLPAQGGSPNVGGGEPVPSGGGGLAAGLAGAAGSAAIGSAAKVLKDKQGENG